MLIYIHKKQKKFLVFCFVILLTRSSPHKGTAIAGIRSNLITDL